MFARVGMISLGDIVSNPYMIRDQPKSTVLLKTILNIFVFKSACLLLIGIYDMDSQDTKTGHMLRILMILHSTHIYMLCDHTRV